MIDTVIHADCLEALRKMPDNSIDSLVCDPPAGIAFMGKAFDSDRGGRDKWITWLAEIMREAFRVLKPGAHGLVWSLPRTSHWTATALEDAGFEIRDNIYHLYAPDTKLQAFYASLSQEQRNLFTQVLDSQDTPANVLALFGSGFPKSLGVSKQIDKLKGQEREVTGEYIRLGDKKPYPVNSISSIEFNNANTKGTITAPASPEAQQYAGYGSALKPSCECWWLVRKPLAEKSIAANVLEYGTGAINIDASRIPSQDQLGRMNKTGDNGWKNSSGGPSKATYDPVAASGRFPAHLLLSHTLECTEEQCIDGCPVLEMDRQSGTSKSSRQIKAKAGNAKFNGRYANGELYTNQQDQIAGHNDQGGASRYFQQFYYAPKASRRERNAGCEELPEHRSDYRVNDPDESTLQSRLHGSVPKGNHHPTVKSQSLMSWLVRLITPPDGIVLDPFGGSGSTALACISESFHYILIEREEEYVSIARARIVHAEKQKREVA